MNITKKIKKRISHHLGLRPFLEKTHKDQKIKYIPEGYKAVITVSADFELAWAWQHAKNFNLDEALKHAHQARKNIPFILDLCDEYSIPITWFTVGHLFLENCNTINGLKHPEINRLPFFENQYWSYKEKDWFKNDPCGDLLKNPEWYAPDIIHDILNRRTKHEIGCHTFSHIDCRDIICTKEIFDSELNACKDAAKNFNLTLKSFVHPAHTIGNLKNLQKHGFTSYRDNSKQTIGYPEKENHLWKYKSTAILNYSNENEKFQIKKLKRIIARTIKANATANIWFHPSANPKTFEILLDNLFQYLQLNKDKIYITTVDKYIDFLNQNTNE